MKSNSEIEYLKELIQDFGTEQKISPDEAFELLRIRYEVLEKNIPVIVDPLIKDSRIGGFGLTVKSNLQSINFPTYFFHHSRVFHQLLFKDILINAGSFRKSSDPREGYVGFGGESRRRIGSHKFIGSSPKDIDHELLLAFKLLAKNSNHPIYDGLEFYRRFVNIHPFYDANGRIGRLILSIYLLYFDYHINWRAIESGGNKNSFIRKLNKCHLREDKFNYDKYFNILLSFFNKFVISTDELKDKEIL